MEPELKQRVDDWLRLDKNPDTTAEIAQLVASGSHEELSSRFKKDGRIKFGTAGLRARMAAGPGFMNDLVVIQSSQGIAAHALEVIEGAADRGVVVGHDHRYNSKRFAQLTARAFKQKGFKVFLFDGIVHTPMVPVAVRRLSAALGVMITASHNPAQDNGYKLYWSNAIQIIPPLDAAIASRILQELEVEAAAWEIDANEWTGTEELKAAYFELLSRSCTQRELNATTPLSLTYTAMHGVGLEPVKKAWEAYGFPASALHIVEAQAQPDPDFPTVKFPNPEEKGALDLALAAADANGSRLVVANDPDADRFCAAEKKQDGTWHVFSGDELGGLLGHWLFGKYQETEQPINKFAVCASTVSSKMLKAMAEKEGFQYRETLTGFKYLGNEVATLSSEGLAANFAYEEAIGYMTNPYIRDKDGVTALVTFAEMATFLARFIKPLEVQLDSLYWEYGYHKTKNGYVISHDPAVTDQIFSELRYGTPSPPEPSLLKSSLKAPEKLGVLSIKSFRDLTVGYDSTNPPSFQPSMPVDPTSHMVSFTLGSRTEGDKILVTGTVRTSGTEPKIKYYLEASGDNKNRPAVAKKLDYVCEMVAKDWLQGAKYGLQQSA